MCGRAFRSGQFKQDVIKSVIHSSMMDMDVGQILDTPGEVKPGDRISGIDTLGRVITATWGFDNEISGGLIYNTRSEKLNSSWWTKLHTVRVSVPVSSFCEKQGVFHGKRPVVWLAGITDGEHLSIVTAPANGDVVKFHHRMPLTLADTTIDTWIRGGLPKAAMVRLT